MPAPNPSELLELTGLLYDTMLEDDLWPVALRRVCEVFGSGGILVHSIERRNGRAPLALSHGFPDQHLDEHNGHTAESSPRLRFALENPQVKYLYDYLHTSDEEIDQNEYYDWLQRTCGFRYYLAARLDIPHTFSAFVSLQRTPKQGHVDKPTIEQFAQLVPHLERAVLICQRFAGLDFNNTALYEILERLPYAVYLLDTRGRLLFTNGEGQTILSAQDGLCVNGRELNASRRADNRELQQLLGRILDVSLDANTPPGALAIARPSGLRPYALMATPLSTRKLSFAAEHPVAAVFVTDPETNQELPQETLRQLYGLTPKEAHLAALLATGITVQEAADCMGCACSTVRLHLEHIFDKTGTHRQAELVRRLLGTNGCSVRVNGIEKCIQLP